MKKFFLVGFILLLCGCGVVQDTIDDVSSTKYGLAKNSVSGYANAVMVSYTDYQYASAMGNFEASDDGVPVNIDGNVVNLKIKYYGDNVVCSNISVVNGSVKLDDCSVYGYTFSYDGEVIDK